MKKGLAVAVMAATVLLMCGAVASRFDIMWGAIFGLFGLLISVICAFFFVTLKAIEERERGRNQEW